MGSQQLQAECIQFLGAFNQEETVDSGTDITSAVEELLGICTLLARDADNLSEQILAALGTFESIRLRRSQMLQVMGKLRKMIPSSSKSATKEKRKLGPGANKKELSEICQLSPIPEEPVAEMQPLTLASGISKDSPKSVFREPKTWKKGPRKAVFLGDKESLKTKLSFEENEKDPMEGPSLLDTGNFGISLPRRQFLDCPQRKRRFSSLFDKVDACSMNAGVKSQKSSQEPSSRSYEGHEKTDEERDSFPRDSRFEKTDSMVLPPKNEGRQRRKAAPTFKLVEPELRRKLRRN